MAKKKFILNGNKSASKLMDVIANNEQAEELLKFANSESSTQLTKEEAIELIVNNNLTKHSYNRIRNKALEHHINFYPSYKNVIEKYSTITKEFYIKVDE